MSDAELVRRLREGDEAAFRAAVRAHEASVFAFLSRLSGDRQLAEELLQQTWLKLAESAPRLAEDTRLKAWLFTVARNGWFSHRRWQRLDLLRLAELAFWRRGSRQVRDPEQEAESAQQGERVERALAGLAPKAREALLLVSVEGLQPADAARIAGVSAEAFRQRLSRAREALRAALAELEPPHV